VISKNILGYESVLNLLSKLAADDLYHAIGNEKLSQLQKIVGDNSDIEHLNSRDLARHILALYGHDLLYEKRIRHLLFTLIDNEKLKALALRYGKIEYEKVYDNALALSTYPWKAGSDLVIEIAKELPIAKEYLPLSTNSNQTIEIIEPIDPLNPLLDYQEELRRKIYAALMENKKKFLVQMPTGSGKTRTVIQGILDYIRERGIFENSQSIVWIAHTEELCEQAIDTFKDIWQHLATTPAQIVRCFRSYNPNSFDVIGSFLVCTFQKLYSIMQKQPDVFLYIKKATQVIIVDEAHKVIAPTYLTVINAINTADRGATLIGLTATPGRGADKRKENIELAKYFDKVLLSPDFSKNPILELREKKVLAKINRRVIESGINVRLNESALREIDDTYDIPQSIVKKLSVNTKRNKIILDLIIDELRNGNPCLVFSCSIDHSKLLSAALVFQGYKSAYIDCDMRKGSRKRIIEDFRKGNSDVLFNYGVLSTGFDAPRIKTVIITRPTSSIVLYSQMVGRGLRGPRMGGTETCNLIDIIDNYSNFGGVEDVYTYFEDYWH